MGLSYTPLKCIAPVKGAVHLVREYPYPAQVKRKVYPKFIINTQVLRLCPYVCLYVCHAFL